MVTEFALEILLKIIKLARSTYYYHLKQLDQTDKNQTIKAELQAIFTEHKGNYGYRRITLALRNRGFVVNHKKVQRLMKVLGLTARIRRKHKYYSYQGEVGKIPDRTAKAMFSAIQQLCELFPKEALKTFTSDRGKEFACYPLVENLGISFFFADAYSSWQRGSNENANGLLREYFPKKTDLATISDEDLNKALCDINHRPRKCLGYRTACEALKDEFE